MFRVNRHFIYIQMFVVLMFLAVANVKADSNGLGVGDTVKVTVYGQPDLTTITRINNEGKITFPLIGEVEIAGLSVRQAEDKVARQLLNRGIVKNPQVNIFLEQQQQTGANTATILGQVNRPGKYTVEGPSAGGIESVVDLLAIAGGVNPYAADKIMLIRNSKGKETKISVDLVAMLEFGDLTQNYPVKGGDIVFVPKMDVFYIYGQVQSPGRYRLERNMTVMQALSVGGGLTPRGTEKGITLRRQSSRDSIESIDADTSFKLKPNDVIYIKESIF